MSLGTFGMEPGATIPPPQLPRSPTLDPLASIQDWWCRPCNLAHFPPSNENGLFAVKMLAGRTTNTLYRLTHVTAHGLLKRSIVEGWSLVFCVGVGRRLQQHFVIKQMNTAHCLTNPGISTVGFESTWDTSLQVHSHGELCSLMRTDTPILHHSRPSHRMNYPLE